MKIFRSNQYNQGVGKYKLLSSTAGVGSIIMTKIGSYILISDINKWKFINWINSKIEFIRNNNADDREVYRLSKNEINNRGLELIDDKRFLNFVRVEQNLKNLVALVGIPQISLNETFNTPNWKTHPIKSALEKAGEQFEGVSSHYMIPGTHFPKWFKNYDGELKKISQWKSMWENECRKYPDTLKKDYFSPPRDASKFIKEKYIKNEDGNQVKIREYKILEQSNLVLICPNGHLDDIPWPNFLRWKTEKILRIRNDSDKGSGLLSNEMVGPCCPNPKLKWTESKTKSEGFGSVYIECLNCGLGSNSEKEKPKVNLEGINSLEPICRGHKPWEIDIENPGNIPKEDCFIRNESSNGNERMKVSLVTANNVYYANGFSSLYIPMHIAENKTKEIIDSIEILEKKYQKYFLRNTISREEYWQNKFDLEDFLTDNDIKTSDEIGFANTLKNEFLKLNTQKENFDRHEYFRWQEFRCFSENISLPNIEENNGLKFKDIDLPEELKPYFKKIQQVEELKVTNIQLEFTRVKPKERIVLDGIVQESSVGQNIYSVEDNKVFALPANESLGEGLFFEFSFEQIDEWVAENIDLLKPRFEKYFLEPPVPNSQGVASKMKVFNNKYKQFLIHSFSHMMMRELEFSCGYPTASMKERLYISENEGKYMAGVLLYTAEGSEGSMGGLVSQGEPFRILEIIKNGLERNVTCSSDPLCWESDGQGLFDLNLASCFSCSLVAETACEEMNLGLDRRVLVDENFGYFKNLIY